jgi:hypothetical protein
LGAELLFDRFAQFAKEFGLALRSIIELIVCGEHDGRRGVNVSPVERRDGAEMEILFNKLFCGHCIRFLVSVFNRAWIAEGLTPKRRARSDLLISPAAKSLVILFQSPRRESFVFWVGHRRSVYLFWEQARGSVDSRPSPASRVPVSRTSPDALEKPQRAVSPEGRAFLVATAARVDPAFRATQKLFFLKAKV